MGSRSRRKGHNYERDVARRIRALTGQDVTRGAQSRGAAAPDVDLPGWWVECKRQIRPDPWKALAQAERDAEGTGRTPIAVVQRDCGPGERKGSAEIVAMRFDTFMDLMRRFGAACSVHGGPCWKDGCRGG